MAPHTIKCHTFLQGWEFAHLISERIARFLSKNERFAQNNEQFTHSLIFGELPERFALDRSFPLSDLSESLIFGEQHERFTRIAHVI